MSSDPSKAVFGDTAQSFVRSTREEAQRLGQAGAETPMVATMRLLGELQKETRRWDASADRRRYLAEVAEMIRSELRKTQPGTPQADLYEYLATQIEGQTSSGPIERDPSR